MSKKEEKRDKNITILSLDNLKERYSQRIPTGSLSLDIATKGGIPRGTLIEYCGKDGAGKSTMTMKLVAESQKLGKVCYISTESEPDFYWMEFLGIQLKDDLIEFPRYPSAEVMFDDIHKKVLSNNYSLIIIDSITAAVPADELDTKIGNSMAMAVGARLISRFVNKTVYGLLGHTNHGHNLTTIVFTNQYRVKIKEGWGRSAEIDYEFPRGYPLRHAKNGSILFNSGSQIKDEGLESKPTIGKTIHFEIIKGKAFQGEGYKGSIDLYFKPYDRAQHGIDRLMELRTYGAIYGIITRGGPYYTLFGEKFLGEDALFQHLINHPEIEKELESKIYTIINNNGSLVETPTVDEVKFDNGKE